MTPKRVRGSRRATPRTSVAAELLGLHEVGVLAAGKVADIVGMSGNPFTDIGVTGNVDFVMKEGVVYTQPPDGRKGSSTRTYAAPRSCC